MRLAFLATFLMLAASPAASLAQQLDILPDPQVRLISEEISGDAAYAHARHNSQFHRPRGGSDGLWKVAQYYEEKAREYGLADVKLIKQAYGATRPWNAKLAELWITGDNPQRIASTIQTPLHLADFSRPADVTAELVDIGGATAAELEGKNVNGKIVLTYAPVATVMQHIVGGRGAAGIVWYPSPFYEGSGTDGSGFNLPDQVRWASLPSGQVEGREPTFAFILSLRQGVELRNRLAAAPGAIRVRALVDAGFSSMEGDRPWQVMVEGFIRGSEPSLGQDVVLTAHMQEEGQSANDDASGTGSVLEIARALNKLINDGRIPRPRRNLRFWWVTEFSSQRQYFADNPEAHRQMWVNVNQDMVGADQSLDIMRKQGITRVPASRFHFLNDVAESVVEFMVRGNTYELSQAQAGVTTVYPRPHLSRLGTRQRYNAEMIFFHGNTDHVPFNEAPIGIPGITFTNMPDRFIHSSDDDLQKLDPTQLGRNAAAAALIAYTMASADAALAPGLAAETAGRGAERMARNLRLGLQWISTSADRAAAYHDAVDQVKYAAGRERLAAASIASIHTTAAGLSASLAASVSQREGQAMLELGSHYRALTGDAPPRGRAPDETERRLASLRPALAAGPREFLEGRGQIAGVSGLHGLMAFELLNLVDGSRSGLDIYRYASAEAREAGAHYFGTVTPAAVLQYLTNAATAGMIRLR
ncbi:MAG: M28 family peptidase [Gemmatimonadaceae bacterium]